jgi:hypothetical protein
MAGTGILSAGPDFGHPENHATSVEVPAELKQKKVVSPRQIGIADLVRGVGCELWGQLDGCTGREVSSWMVAREPVGSQCDTLADGLLNPELPSRFVPLATTFDVKSNAPNVDRVWLVKVLVNSA